MSELDWAQCNEISLDEEKMYEEKILDQKRTQYINRQRAISCGLAGVCAVVANIAISSKIVGLYTGMILFVLCIIFIIIAFIWKIDIFDERV